MSVQQLPATAPDFTLDHVIGQKVSLGDYKGRRMIVVFGGRESAGQVMNGIGTIRAKYLPNEMPIIGVSDLRAAPRPARILVKSQLKKAYQEAVNHNAERYRAAGQEPPADGAKDVVMLMDWDGKVVDSFGLRDVDKEAVAVVVEGDGQIMGSGSGAGLGDEVVAILSQ
ncbi:MAG: hypothetical protein WCD11_08630 [Solirubrobacteraceae bacterium]